MASKLGVLLVVGLMGLSSVSYSEREKREERVEEQFKQKRPGESKEQYDKRMEEWQRTGKTPEQLNKEGGRKQQESLKGLNIPEKVREQGAAKSEPGVKHRAGRPKPPQKVGGHEEGTLPESLKSASGRPEAEGVKKAKVELSEEQVKEYRAMNKMIATKYSKVESKMTKESILKETLADSIIQKFLKDVPKEDKEDMEIAIKQMVKEHEEIAKNEGKEFDLAKLEGEIGRFMAFQKTLEGMLPNDLAGHLGLQKNFARNMFALYRRNPGALEHQINQMKKFLENKDTEGVRVVLRGLALTAESYGNPYFKALHEGKDVATAHKEAIKAMSEFLKERGLTAEEFAEFDKECFKGSDVNFLGLSQL